MTICKDAALFEKLRPPGDRPQEELRSVRQSEGVVKRANGRRGGADGGRGIRRTWRRAGSRRRSLSNSVHSMSVSGLFHATEQGSLRRAGPSTAHPDRYLSRESEDIDVELNARLLTCLLIFSSIWAAGNPSSPCSSITALRRMSSVSRPLSQIPRLSRDRVNQSRIFFASFPAPVGGPTETGHPHSRRHRLTDHADDIAGAR